MLLIDHSYSRIKVLQLKGQSDGTFEQKLTLHHI